MISDDVSKRTKHCRVKRVITVPFFPLSSSSLSMSSSYEMGGVFKRLTPGGVCATNRAPGHGGATRVCDVRSYIIIYIFLTFLTKEKIKKNV